MVTTRSDNTFVTTFITPGQRFEATFGSMLPEESLTVARLARDRFGFLHVTLRTGTGREISAFAEQVEIAVNEGHLVPVNAATPSIAC